MKNVKKLSKRFQQIHLSQLSHSLQVRPLKLITKPADKKSRPNWRPFEEARAFVHSLGLKKKNDWKVWVKGGRRPKDIPSNPNKTYKDTGWKGWGDWLGTGRIASFNMVYRPYNEAREVARNMSLVS